MTALAVNLEDFHEPSVEEIDAARVAARKLARLHGAGKPISFVSEAGEGQEAGEPITIPANIFKTIITMLKEMGNGNAVAVVPVQAELTTQQAADLLNVSRPHLIKLLDQGQIPFRMVGTHRKLTARDVISHQDRTGHARREALTRITALDEELGLYDDEQVGGNE